MFSVCGITMKYINILLLTRETYKVNRASVNINFSRNVQMKFVGRTSKRNSTRVKIMQKFYIIIILHKVNIFQRKNLTRISQNSFPPFFNSDK